MGGGSGGIAGSILGGATMGPLGALAGGALGSGGGGDIWGQLTGQSAISSAADAQTSAIGRAIAQLQQTGQNVQTQFQPYQQAGQSAISQLLAPGGIEMSPEYQAILQTGMKNINAQAAARGQYFSPSTVQALGQYGMKDASEYYSSTLHDLLSQAQLGMGATAYGTREQTGIASNIVNLLTGQGQIQAQAGMAKQAGKGQLLGLAGGIGGSILGGPAGGMAGSQIGGKAGGGGGSMNLGGGTSGFMGGGYQY